MLGNQASCSQPPSFPRADAVVTAAARKEPHIADLNEIIKERDACGVGFIASLKSIATHDVISKSLQALGCMEHRGACSADNDSGDGAGVMTQIPWDLFKKEIPELKPENTGVGMVFLPNDDEAEKKAIALIEEIIKKEGLKLVAWRDVPVDHSLVGRFAKVTQPRIKQVFIESELEGDALERELYLARKGMESLAEDRLGDVAPDLFFCSMSNRTIVYKGMLRSAVVGPFFKDLTNPDYTTCFAIYHRRFSTNTTPKWPLAQPFRLLGHNGEINTLQGNINWVASRQGQLTHPVWEGREQELMPLSDTRKSDSANLDGLAELMVQTGKSPQEALLALVPEAYRNHPELAAKYPEAEAFYEFWEGLQEGWDGPALLVFSDGKRIGAHLDRNGLRPARFWKTNDDMIYVASEVGVLNDIMDNAPNVVAKGRLGPGQIIVADLESGTFKEHGDVIAEVAGAAPYAEWLKSSTRMSELGASKLAADTLYEPADCLKMQAAHGFGQEDAQMVIEGMAAAAAEPTYCMGDDIPLAVLSDKPHPMATYFKQRFAQVTNPPIDPLREGLVMSLEMRLGARGNLLTPGPDSYRQVLLDSPVLLESELEAITNGSTGLAASTFELRYKTGGPGSLRSALEALCASVEKAVRTGCEIVVLSDKVAPGEMDPSSPPIPSLLAVGAVHHHLIKTELRSDTSLVVETAQCFSTHHVATLVGYGVHAVCPYLGFETCRQWRLSPRTQSLIKSGKTADVSVEQAQVNYKKALEKGVLKILSKMGISLLNTYQGAQIFEAYGLGPEVVDFAFRGSVSRIGGLTMDDVAAENEAFWVKGFPEVEMKKLEDYGYIQSRPKGEYHANNQTMAKLLHKAIGLGGGDSDAAAFDAYKEHFDKAPVKVLRDCLELSTGKAPIPVEEVEPAASIMARFCTGGMSLGAISRETHETIAIAMNRIGGKSNSGEGGEDPVRWEAVTDADADGKSSTQFPYLSGMQNGDLCTSRIKQVASGRFGVTPQFLMNADQLEIKVAQGAKPGEGGQLPGQKVSPYIASLRRSKPGVPLISPPPHHDIYSIEDLAQLIYDLHQINANAKVSVKLVAEAGIGTVASGVAKANADVIQISGHDGGTGASPVSSIKHAGGPMEMGLVETHNTLVENELRERVVLRVDGGVRTGLDVLKAAAMGGDEYGFGTVAMIATGCIMARVCHTNNCPVGVASQREELRARFPGTPGDVVNYFHFVAEEVRQGLASLGLRSMDELVGRLDYLKPRGDLELAKTSSLDLSFLTTYVGPCEPSSTRIAAAVHDNGPQLDDEVLADADVMAAIESGGSVSKSYSCVNTDRSCLARVAGQIAKRYGDDGFPGKVELTMTGSGGQSFGVFLCGGMHVKLIGEANDYICKGMSGGSCTIVPPPNAGFVAEASTLVGNTCLYGATGGRLFVNGRAGERFAVRNSMATSVVEGAGDHCCEYMTGGTVVVLGAVGRNVAAGMTGGLGYFLDEEGDFTDKVNAEIVKVQRVVSKAGEAQLKGLLEEHVERTGSAKATALLADWDSSLPKFWQLVPPSEKETPEASPLVEAKMEATAAATVSA